MPLKPLLWKRGCSASSLWKFTLCRRAQFDSARKLKLNGSNCAYFLIYFRSNARTWANGYPAWICFGVRFVFDYFARNFNHTHKLRIKMVFCCAGSIERVIFSAQCHWVCPQGLNGINSLSFDIINVEIYAPHFFFLNRARFISGKW